MNRRALLQLARIPNVFTAFANVAAGALLARRGDFHASDLLLVLASGCLYVGGMVLNDYFDREVDAVERPERPIPSGQVEARFALALGMGLLGAGVAMAAAVSSLSGAVAAALACAILLYDGGVKAGPLGPVAMGACRFLNVCLGLSAGGGAAPPETWMWIAPATMGCYTYVITYLSRDEVGGSSAARARSAVAMVATVLIAALVLLVVASPARRFGGFVGLLPFAALVAWGARTVFRPLLGDPTGAGIGRAIGGGILLMPAIDAAMVAASGCPEGAAAVLLLIVPAMAFKRAFYMT